jgi:glucose-6-phosphate 1-dehydrogenase
VGADGEIAIFLSTAPSLFKPTIDNLEAVGLAGPHVRLALEKPLGTDLASSRSINDAVAAAFPRGADVPDRPLPRQGNGPEPAGAALRQPAVRAGVEQRHIDHVQITVAETVGLEGRGDYYDGAGALRDMVQNHMLQLLALVAMEPPSHFDATAVRDEKVKVLRSLRPIRAEDSVTGQYAPARSAASRCRPMPRSWAVRAGPRPSSR